MGKFIIQISCTVDADSEEDAKRSVNKGITRIMKHDDFASCYGDNYGIINIQVNSEGHVCSDITETPIVRSVEKNGDIVYTKNGKYHNVSGPAIESADGTKYWFLNGKLHRETGPAVEWSNGNKYWYRNDRIHNDNGPAVEKANGTLYWYRNGINISKEEFNNLTAK